MMNISYPNTPEHLQVLKVIVGKIEKITSIPI